MIVLLLAVSALLILFAPDHAPVVLALVLFITAIPWREAWKSASGTALRPALIWVALAIAAAIAAQGFGWIEPVVGGRPGAGRLTYLSVLAGLAALISVLNARTPGGRVWAGLMVVLVLVFLIPWLEGPWRLRRAGGLSQLHLDAPWTIFYGLLVLVGVTNYLPTRFGAAAACMSVCFILEYFGLTRDDWPPGRRALIWMWVSWTLAASVWLARWGGSRVPVSRSRLELLWFWFRDFWGVVWALRIMERWNRTAELKGWLVRLSWFGLVPVDSASIEGPMVDPPGSEAALRGLIRRFAQAGRLDEVLALDDPSSCGRANSAR